MQESVQPAFKRCGPTRDTRRSVRHPAKEIAEFGSGKAEGYERERVMKSAALTAEQREILEKRGVLGPDEIHRLASKMSAAVGARSGSRAECHSDYSDADSAQSLQEQKLVQLRTKTGGAAAE